MNVFVALVAGYLVGARTGRRDLDRLGRSIRALCGTEEFADVVSAARSQLGNTLREMAGTIDGEHRFSDPGGDLVARVSHLVGHD